MAAADELHAAWRPEDHVAEVDGLQGLSLTSFRHATHGTQAVLAKAVGPLCSVRMYFATEAHDDKGLVHCLEHLCFMGSQGYKRGYIDLLATRCGCEGVNAYTDADHTCYYYEAAGEGGVLAILPVFVDHVLCPLLSENSFTTEIFHVNGKGMRQGVVFSEMLGRVTDEQEMLDLERRRATFGENSAYSHEHGGMPDEIAQLTREEIVNYHRQVYTTDNLRVVVSGSFDQARVLGALNAALEESITRGAGSRCTRYPFVEPLPSLPIDCARRRTVAFPSDDISVGTVVYAHRLQGVALCDSAALAGIDCLARYLTSLASSPLEQAFVQCEPPVASGVTVYVSSTAEPHVSIELAGVPFQATPEERLAAKRMGGGEDESDGDDDEAGDEEDEDEGKDEEDEEEEEEDGDEDEDETNWFEGDLLLQRVVEELGKVYALLRDGDEKTVVELRQAVKKEAVALRESFEDAPNEFVCGSLSPFLIFDKYPGAMSPGASAVRTLPARAAALETLLAQPSAWWAELLEAHLLRPLAVTLQGEPGGTAEVRSCPSAVLATKSERKEEKAAKQNAKKLGAKKLKALQERVDSAEAANLVSLTEEQRNGFPAPATPDCVPDLPWSMELAEEVPAESGLEVLEVEVASCFVELRIKWRLDEGALPGRRGEELRRYLPLFAELLCETNVAGEDYRSVVARLDDELVSYCAHVSEGGSFLSVGSFPHWLTLQLSAEPARSGELVTWADRLAHECEFPEDVVLSCCKRLISDVKESMREGGTVLGQVLPCALYEPLSPHVQFGALSQKPFLERCCKDVASACAALRELRDALTAPGTAASAMVSGGSAELRAAVLGPLQRAWRARADVPRPPMLREAVWGTGAVPSPKPLMPLRHFVVGCAAADTTTVHLSATLPQPSPAGDARKSWALRLLCEALSMMEGPLSTAVRGKGLAYGVSVGFSQYSNAVTLDLYECTNVKKAIQGTLGVLRDVAEGDSLSMFQLDNARGSLVFQLKGKRATPTDVVGAAVASATRSLHTVAAVQEWENQLGSVSKEDVLEVHAECLMRLCDASQVLAIAVCDPGDCKKNAKALAGGLGVDAGSVRTKEKINDCYSIVDGCIRAALETMPA